MALAFGLVWGRAAHASDDEANGRPIWNGFGHLGIGVGSNQATAERMFGAHWGGGFQAAMGAIVWKWFAGGIEGGWAEFDGAQGAFYVLHGSAFAGLRSPRLHIADVGGFRLLGNVGHTWMTGKHNWNGSGTVSCIGSTCGTTNSEWVDLNGANYLELGVAYGFPLATSPRVGGVALAYRQYLGDGTLQRLISINFGLF